MINTLQFFKQKKSYGNPKKNHLLLFNNIHVCRVTFYKN